MERYNFSGSVNPQRAMVERLVLPPLSVVSPHSERPLTVRISILLSQLSVAVDSEVNIHADIYTLKNIVQATTASAVDVLGYTLGHAYDVEITSVTYGDAEYVVFGIDIPALVNERESRPLSVDRVFELVLQDHHAPTGLS